MTEASSMIKEALKYHSPLAPAKASRWFCYTIALSALTDRAWNVVDPIERFVVDTCSERLRRCGRQISGTRVLSQTTNLVSLCTVGSLWIHISIL